MSFVVLDPVGTKPADHYPLATRQTTLADGVVGLLSNGKPNADQLLEALGRRLVADYGVKETLLFNKVKHGVLAGSPAPDVILNSLASKTIAVLTATGD